ncbi:uncharacterized protein LOC125778155 [Bactrocera dorsalis]|uniref:Uncharacterized protein LOC125778155 n=1 Tax=Bactrocera dorsalis TaxID=27457 RepID=A0ABM3JN90_BACDO|nr:uncharacterized protein LOC125778155 [Bactrocera dorsalis]
MSGKNIIATLFYLSFYIKTYYVVKFLRKFSTNFNTEVAPPAKRKRQKPNKKWKESEVHSIIEFLMEEADFEAPTAQLFYKRFLHKTQLDVSWDLVWWKVRHLKAQYRKANDWLASTGAGLQDEGDGRIIEAKIAKMSIRPPKSSVGNHPLADN